LLSLEAALLPAADDMAVKAFHLFSLLPKIIWTEKSMHEPS
jgi:hypothetical protein